VTPCSVEVGYQQCGGLCCLHLEGEDRDSKALQKVGILLQYCMVSQPIRHWLESRKQSYNMGMISLYIPFLVLVYLGILKHILKRYQDLAFPSSLLDHCFPLPYGEIRKTVLCDLFASA